MFKKILIANRGEIALRIIRACRDLDIKSVAVYSEADQSALHAKLADESFFIGAAPSSDSYLNKEKIFEAIKLSGADAVHPGYGFYSENAEFIKEVEEMGIEFIGPSASSVNMMGSKTAARSLMKKNGVPIVPGTTSAIEDISDGLKTCKEIGYPVLLKASGGGGGKGMRKVNSEKEFESAFEATQREAQKSFGSSAIYIEKFIENPKHIEVQVIADKAGNYVHLFERECSVQRRHQKIIEEAPSAFVDPDTRERICSAAIDAAKACGYYNAGTIEFLMDKEKNFYFLEMNTRLQVEHPVTELITGIDLVKEQIKIAAGEKLSFTQSDLKIIGHAIECRIYAEDPYSGFLPSTGLIKNYKEPAGPGVRLDSGFENGSYVTMHYDPLIAKLITWGDSRRNAISRMIRALYEYHISGVTHNISFLRSVLDHKEFKDADYTINFIEQHMEHLITNLDGADKDNIYETAALLITALIKTESSHTHLNNSQKSSNRWAEQLYE